MPRLPPSWPGQRRGSPAAWRSSTARNLELSAEVEAGSFLEHIRGHRLPAPRLHLRQAVAVAGLDRFPHGDPHHLVPVRRVELVRFQHPLGKLAGPPGAAELLSGARLELPSRDPDVAVEIHAPQVWHRRGRQQMDVPASRRGRPHQVGRSSRTSAVGPVDVPPTTTIAPPVVAAPASASGWGSEPAPVVSPVRGSMPMIVRSGAPAASAPPIR